jgi:hypothetical protein
MLVLAGPAEVVPAPGAPPTLVQEENKTGDDPAVIKRIGDVFFIFPTLACTTVTSECERLLLARGLVYASLERSDAAL